YFVRYMGFNFVDEESVFLIALRKTAKHHDPFLLTYFTDSPRIRPIARVIILPAGSSAVRRFRPLAVSR
ncbi:MAG TPA: hypothetical protein VH196_10590, partial [Terriglobales bacterium]|nr:hypothetical protein [Terriglobales bacterium]